MFRGLRRLKMVPEVIIKVDDDDVERLIHQSRYITSLESDQIKFLKFFHILAPLFAINAKYTKSKLLW